METDMSPSKKKLHAYTCAECHGANVSHVMWVRLNEDSPEDVFGSWCDGENSWCDDCDKHVPIDTLDVEVAV